MTREQCREILRQPWVILGIGLCVVLIVLVTPLHGLDFRVYREGASVLVADNGDQSLYDPVPQEAGTRGLPFTYPPFAALLFLPFAAMPVWLGMTLMTASTLACLVGVALLVATYLGRLESWQRRETLRTQGLTFLAAAALIGISGPWRESLDFGQINAVIMALVVVDLVRPARAVPRGVLIGIAAGIKLTPLAFGLIFVARRDLRSLIMMAAGFAGTVLIGWLVAPEESRTFWSGLLGAADRVGDPSAMYNLSLNALLFHLGLEGSAQRIVWILGSLAIVGLGYLAIRAAERRGDVVAGIASNAVVMLAISPVSWFHHWVWVALLIPVVWARASCSSKSARLGGQALAVLLYPAFVLSSFAVTILLTGEVQETGPLSWKLLSSAGLVLALVGLIYLAWITPRWTCHAGEGYAVRSHLI